MWRCRHPPIAFPRYTPCSRDAAVTLPRTFPRRVHHCTPSRPLSRSLTRMDLRRTCVRRRKAKRSVCRCLTTGRSCRVSTFLPSLNIRWLNVLPDAGDPTDTSIKLRPLEPASGQALARDLVLKTRRRKGLGDQISVSKYLDDEFIVRVTLSIAFLTRADGGWVCCSLRCRRRGMQTCSGSVQFLCVCRACYETAFWYEIGRVMAGERERGGDAWECRTHWKGRGAGG